MRKLFITDLDGTLLNDDKTISTKDINTLTRLKQNNIFTAIATGRSAYSFERALPLMGMANNGNDLPVDYVIFSTGAGVMEFKDRTLLLKKEINPEDIKTVTRCFDRYLFDYMVHQTIPDTRRFLYQVHSSHNVDFHSRLALYPDYAAPLKNGFNHIMPATEVLAIVPPGRVDEEKIKQIREELNSFSVIQATSPLDHASTWIEVFHEDVSKSQSAIWLSGKLGVDSSNIVAVGNDYNDEDLLEIAGKGYVVDNAPSGLKEKFSVVSSNNQSGVSRAVKRSSLLEKQV